MRITDTIYKDNNTNYKTNSFKLIKTLGYNGASIVETLRNLDLDIFSPYAVNSPLLVDKRLGLSSGVLKALIKRRSRNPSGTVKISY